MPFSTRDRSIWECGCQLEPGNQYPADQGQFTTSMSSVFCCRFVFGLFSILLQIKSVWLAMRSFCMDMGFPYHRWHCSLIILEGTAALKASQYSEILKRLFCKQSFHAEWEPGLSPFLLMLPLSGSYASPVHLLESGQVRRAGIQGQAPTSESQLQLFYLN